MRAVSSEETLNSFDTDYKHCKIRYGDMKKKLAEDIIEFLGPIRERIAELEQDEKYLKDVAAYGAERARKSAKETLDGVRDIVGVGRL